MRNINLALPEELIIELDEAAKRRYMSRTEYIRLILNEQVAGKHPEAIERAEEENIARFADLDDS